MFYLEVPNELINLLEIHAPPFQDVSDIFHRGSVEFQ